ncbi:hypothetical protein D3C87_1916530 [compost metagenome]
MTAACSCTRRDSAVALSPPMLKGKLPSWSASWLECVLRRQVVKASSRPVAATAANPLMVLNHADAYGPSEGARPPVASISKGMTAMGCAKICTASSR